MAEALLCDPVQPVSSCDRRAPARAAWSTRRCTGPLGHARIDHRSHAGAPDAIGGVAGAHAVRCPGPVAPGPARPAWPAPHAARAAPRRRRRRCCRSSRRPTSRDSCRLRRRRRTGLRPSSRRPRVNGRRAGTPALPSCRTARTRRWAWCRSDSSNPASARPNGASRSGRRGGARGCLKTPAAWCSGFAFDTLGVHRLEARVATPNARGNAAVRKLGATAEGLLRRALPHRGRRDPRPGSLGVARRRMATR